MCLWEKIPKTMLAAGTNRLETRTASGFAGYGYDESASGAYQDKETNTHYNYYRDYDPSIGRYVESDPIGLDAGINTYAYVENNPLGFADPLGLWAWGDPFDPDLVNAITGFGDAFLLPELFRNAFGIMGLNQISCEPRAWRSNCKPNFFSRLTISR